MILDWPNFLFAIYDPVDGCINIDYREPAAAPLRWYTFSWSVMTYPVALVLALSLNAAAVFRLRAHSRVLSADEKKFRSETFAKQKAAIGLQRASIALAFIFGITSGPFQVTNSMQVITGTKIMFNGLRFMI